MYFISLFSPGRDYAGLVSKQIDFDEAAECVEGIIITNMEADEPPARLSATDRKMAKREGQMLIAYAPSMVTLHNGAKLFIDREPRRSC